MCFTIKFPINDIYVYNVVFRSLAIQNLEKQII